MSISINQTKIIAPVQSDTPGAGPRTLTPEAIKEGAGITVTTSASGPLGIIRAAISRVEHADLLELAQQYYERPVLDLKGQPRQQSQTELIVLTVEHFGNWMEEIGMGARVLNGAPHLFGGTHWKPINDREFEVLLGDFALRIGCDPVGFGIFTAREKLVKQFHSIHGGQPAERSAGQTLVNFSNGTLEISDTKETMREFRKADILTYQLPFDYNEKAICPMFDRYLVRVLPDASSRMVLAEFIGWLFLRDLKLEKVLLLFGDGHNGKSVFFDVINALLGEHNVSNYGLSSLSKMENRCALGTALLNFGSEINERCDADLFKKMASGEPLEARRLYSDSYIMRDYARLAFNANLLPRDTEHTTGFFRRFLIIPFGETITDAEKDPELARKIIERELSGVFNWVMVGLRRLRQQRRFSSCAAADQALAIYKQESDSTAGFLEDGGWEPSAEQRVGKGELYRAYQEYCRESGHSSLNKLNFGKRLLTTHKIKESKSGNVRFWQLTQSIDP
jgi:putative DNA primase/helicase